VLHSKRLNPRIPIQLGPGDPFMQSNTMLKSNPEFLRIFPARRKSSQIIGRDLFPAPLHQGQSSERPSVRHHEGPFLAQPETGQSARRRCPQADEEGSLLLRHLSFKRKPIPFVRLLVGGMLELACQ